MGEGNGENIIMIHEAIPVQCKVTRSYAQLDSLSGILKAHLFWDL